MLFGKFTSDVIDAVALSSAGTDRHVLAICAHQEALPAHAAWSLLHAGASDVLSWGSDEESAERVRARIERWHAINELLESPAVRQSLVGDSAVWRRVVKRVIEVGHFTDSPVLLLGDTGTGKELLARTIHTVDARPQRADLHLLDCTTIVPDLAGSEFFGHERGAFTSATGTRDGAFARADGGTLFLDEVGELSLPLQAELLRVIQEGTYKRVGGNTWQKTRFRLVAATNRDLVSEMEEGRFRRDFYYRLAAWTIVIPRLDQRPEDIVPLARHFLREVFVDRPVPDFDPPVSEYLATRHYQGNVRDLRQLVLRIARRHVGPGPITVGDLPVADRPAAGRPENATPYEVLRDAARLGLVKGIGLKKIAHLAAEAAIEIALEHEHGNTHRAARLLGVTDRALQLRRARYSSTAGSPLDVLPSRFKQPAD